MSILLYCEQGYFSSGATIESYPSDKKSIIIYNIEEL